MSKNYKLLSCLILLSSMVIAQDRTLLRGKLSNNLGVIVNGFVFNLNAKKRVSVSEEGFFEILAKPKDTLMLGCLACYPKNKILDKSNFNPPIIEIHIDLFDNELKEVIVNNPKKFKVTNENSQQYVDRLYFDDNQSSPTNPLLPATLTNGVNFVRLFKDISKILQKKKERKQTKNQPINYYKEVTQRIPIETLTKNLKIQEQDWVTFFHFCENDKRFYEILSEQNDFMLMDFLITKNKEFKSLFTFEK